MPVPAALAGDYLVVTGKELGRPFHLYIRHPESYATNPQMRFPIVYILDGDSLFPALAPTQLFTEIDDNIDEAIVVGIAYGSFASPINMRRTDFDTNAPAFARFLASELIPAVEARVRADPARRILFGQSRGGTYALFDAWTQPDLFQARIASNPTLDHPRLAEPPAPATRRDLKVYVSSGERDRPEYRDRALAAFGRWKGSAWPWTFRTTTMPGGTHAADASRVYRWAIRDALAPVPAPNAKP
ncbi:MAG: alpha/beta hydrolase-fold protein [Sphingomicrobium sp.]